MDGIVEDTDSDDATIGKVENGFDVEIIFILPEERSDVPEFDLGLNNEELSDLMF